MHKENSKLNASQLLTILDNAALYGIHSVKQLHFFIDVAMLIESQADRPTLMQLSHSDDGYDPEYKRVQSIFLKLSSGSKSRDRDGLDLLSFLNQGKNKRIILTKKGADLWEAIKILIG
ncbi:hypothetical protein [Marinomonas spartinae]|uniref:hypothetical protein n=1 Tax=Marinomonas spartinae TaxID=1792290 RepID=UPI0018F12D23|nr:hypothetical protein [Marinomonas spartinae]MBJ7556771.1 hypothetical protein [Marinomonas spartinae]